MSLSFISSIHDFNNQGGNARLLGLNRSSRYALFRESDLQSFNLYNDISSARIYNSSTVDGTMVLFGFPYTYINFPDFQGQFLQLTNREDSGSTFDVDQLSSFSFNNSTQSMLLVGPNKDGFDIRISFRNLFLNKWNDFLDDALSGSQANRNGNPTLTWEMFPQGISYLNSNRMYLKIHQKLDIELSWWPDYEATITYHIYLYIDGSGTLRGHVQRWAYWVEGGIKSGAIQNALETQVIAGLASLDDALADEFSAYSGIRFNDLYYLPGNQTTRPPTGVLQGSTTDDVTIVLNI